MSQSQIIRETFEKNGGIFKLIPTFVPRNILPWVLPAVQ